MPSVTFLPLNVRTEVTPGESVFDAGRRLSVPIATSCVGRGTCGLCRVKIVSGEEGLMPFNPLEKKHLGTVYFLTKERLSCQARVQRGDVTVLVLPPRKL